MEKPLSYSAPDRLYRARFFDMNSAHIVRNRSARMDVVYQKQPVGFSYYNTVKFVKIKQPEVQKITRKNSTDAEEVDSIH